MISTIGDPIVVKPVEFAQERFTESLINEMWPLWKAHYHEVALYKDIPLSPDFKLYEQMDKLGMLRVFTARNAGQLVGYEVFFIHTHPHYSGAVEAVQDILFLSQETRRGTIGYRFLKWNDQELQFTKAQVIYRCVTNMNDYGPLLKRLGYQQHDVVYSRRVA